MTQGGFEEGWAREGSRPRRPVLSGGPPLQLQPASHSSILPAPASLQPLYGLPRIPEPQVSADTKRRMNHRPCGGWGASCSAVGSTLSPARPPQRAGGLEERTEAWARLRAGALAPQRDLPRSLVPPTPGSHLEADTPCFLHRMAAGRTHETSLTTAQWLTDAPCDQPSGPLAVCSAPSSQCEPVSGWRAVLRHARPL